MYTFIHFFKSRANVEPNFLFNSHLSLWVQTLFTYVLLYCATQVRLSASPASPASPAYALRTPYPFAIRRDHERAPVDHVEPFPPGRERKLNVDHVTAERFDFDYRSLLGCDSCAQLNLRVAVPVILVVAVAHDRHRHHFLRLGGGFVVRSS